MHMRDRSSPVAVLLCSLGLGVIAAGATVAAQFKSGIEMVPLTVTVTDRTGQYVPDLRAAQFTVFEDGRPQPVSSFAAAQAPVDVAFLIDTSGSMTPDLSIVQEAACGLTRRLKPADRAAVASVASSMTTAQAMTDDLNQVEQAIRALKASGNTALYQGIYVLLREFERTARRSAEMRRQAIVVLSDGIDTVSRIGFEDVLDLARRADVTVYVISLERDPDPAATTQPDRRTFEAAFALRSLARDSGGRMFTPRGARELPAIYDAIASELGNQYLLGYAPARQGVDAAFRRILVRVQHPAVALVRTRAGYYANRDRGGLTAPGIGH